MYVNTSNQVMNNFYPRLISENNQEKFGGQGWDKLKIATLCDEPVGLTCSVDAARKMEIIGEILFSKTFEEAADHVKYGRADAFLVPGAYPGLNKFIMDERLEVFHVCLHKIPALVYACSRDITKEDLALRLVKIYHHPAVSPLLQEIEIIGENFESVEATSNSEACKKLESDVDVSACITNEIFADYYGLKKIQVLREGIAMPWVLFGVSRGGVKNSLTDNFDLPKS